MSKAHGSWFSVKWKIAVLSTVTVPSQHYLGSAVVDQKTNEIPVAREFFKRGLHQRLDVPHNDDRWRVRNDKAMLVPGIMLRLSNSLFMQWRGYQRRPDHVTTTDFQSALSEDHHRPALRLALSKYPSLKGLS